VSLNQNPQKEIGYGVYRDIDGATNLPGYNKVAITVLNANRAYVMPGGNQTGIPDGSTLTIDSNTGAVTIHSASTSIGFMAAYPPVLSLVLWNE
jgi:hypothetical protein